MAVKRAAAELRKLQVDPVVEFTVGPAQEEDPLRWQATIHGPSGSPYEGASFQVEIVLPPDYPFKPPGLALRTDIYHCNLGLLVRPHLRQGDCLLRCGEDWHPSMQVRVLLSRIHALMLEPFDDLDFEAPALEGSSQSRERLETALLDRELAALRRQDRAEFNRTAREWTDLLAKQTTQSDVAAPALLEHGDAAGPVVKVDVDGSGEIALDMTVDGRSGCGSAGAEEAEEASPDSGDVSLPCPLCGTWYAMRVLGGHLEGHFAFDACSLEAHVSKPGGTAEAGTDELAIRLQREEMERTLLDCQALAADRFAAMQLAEEEEPTIFSHAHIGIPWSCKECTMRDGPGTVVCSTCGVATTSQTVDSDAGSFADDATLAATLAVQWGAAILMEKQDANLARALAQASATANAASSSSSRAGYPTPAVPTIGKPANPKVSKAGAMTVKAPVPRPLLAQRMGKLESIALDFAKQKEKKEGCLDASSDEYNLVTEYFLNTLGSQDVRIHGLLRVRSERGTRFRPGSSSRIMFHGCKSTENEARIVHTGFQVTHCVSGGPNYGTWLAYNAAYSDGGFAFNDSKGIRHMFICRVSDAHIVMENDTMRVVGQDCAYPVWIVTYTHSASRGIPTFAVGPYGRWAASLAASVAPTTAFWEAKDGKWVPASPPTTKGG